MKLYRIILTGAAILAFVACSKLNESPVFKAEDAFASFDKTSMAAREDAGRVFIPVTIASVDPVSTTVTYTIDTENSTAVAGVNFNLVDPSAVLTFNGKDRTANIELDIINIEGVFTGDKVVYIKLQNANGLKLGSENVCKVTINDLDHPLSDILGEYMVNGEATVTFEKDATDVTVIHMYDFFMGTQNWCGKPLDFVCQVSKDKNTIVISLPVDTGYTYSNGQKLQVYACDANSVFFDISSITLTRTATGYACEDYGLISYIKGAGYVEYYDPPLNFVKK